MRSWLPSRPSNAVPVWPGCGLGVGELFALLRSHIQAAISRESSVHRWAERLAGRRIEVALRLELVEGVLPPVVQDRFGIFRCEETLELVKLARLEYVSSA
jgi:hypothetical protein